MQPRSSFAAAAALAACFPLLAQTHYFTTTAAGYVPSATGPIALRQYFQTYVGAVAYDAKGRLYYSYLTEVWRLNADGSNTLIAGQPNDPATGGSIGTGDPLTAHLGYVAGIGFDAAQNMYLFGYSIFKIGADGKISILGATPFSANGMAVGPDGTVYLIRLTGESGTSGELDELSPAGKLSVLAELNAPDGVGIAGSSLFIEDGNIGLRKFDLNTGNLTTVVQEQLNGGGACPCEDIVAGIDGFVYFSTGNTISRISASGAGPVQTFAGNGQSGDTGDGGPALQASMSVDQLAVNPVNGDIAVGGGNLVRVISASNHSIQTVAGLSHSGGDNGPAVLASFGSMGKSYAVGNVVADANGNLYLLDRYGARIRKLAPNGIITTVAGTGSAGTTGDGGKALTAQISLDVFYGGMAIDPKGNLYFANAGPSGYSVRMIDLNGNINTVAGGGSAPVTNKAQATSVNFAASGFFCLAVDGAGNLYIGQNFEVLKVDSTGALTILAGNGHFGTPSAGSLATTAIGSVPSIAVDNSGTVYFSSSNVIFTIQQGRLQVIAGAGGTPPTMPITAGPALTTSIGQAEEMTFDAAGNLYFSPQVFATGSQVLMLDPGGNVTPIAGAPTCKTNGDGGDSLQACFAVNGIAIDPSGNIFLVDNDVYVRELSPYNPSNPPPFLSTGGVVGAGGSLPAVAAASPDGLESLFGANFISAAAQHTLQPSDLVNGKVPTNLAGVCVDFGGTPAAMFGVYPSQLNVQTPVLPPGPFTVQVTVNCGKPNAVTSNYGGVVIQAASPEFFSFLPDPVAGKNPITAVDARTYALLGPPGLLQGATFTAAKPNEVVEAYGTSWGATNPAIGVGVIPGAAASLAAPYSITLGGAPVPAANVVYVGASPCCAGLYQLDFIVPAGTPNGNQPIILTVGGAASPPQAYLAIQQ